MKFKTHKSLDVIRAQCVAMNIELDETPYERGADHVVLRTAGQNGEDAEVLYNPINGRFFGTTPTGVRFTSDSTQHDEEEWFQMLLTFFLVPLADGAPATPEATK